MCFVFVFMILQLTVFSAAAQDFGNVVCTDYDDSNPPQVTLASSGNTSVTGVCSVSGGAKYSLQDNFKLSKRPNNLPGVAFSARLCGKS